MKLEKKLRGVSNFSNTSENSLSSELINRIGGFKELEHNWDTYGSEKISLNSISTSIQITETFGANNIIIDHAFPMRDGGVQLEKDFENNSIEIEVSPNNTITLLVFDKEGNLVLEKGFSEFEINDLINIIKDNYGNVQHTGKR